ncbi:MAG: hypothetical protein N2578_03970 [Bdellovibrionaceae bacterium]|nr:hypothetical protein [Pseudobdellovibrionaceae bacterium]
MVESTSESVYWKLGASCVLMAVALAALWWGGSSQKEMSSKSAPKSEEVSKLSRDLEQINRHMKATQMKIEMERARAALEQSLVERSLNSNSPSSGYKPRIESGLDLQHDDSGSEVTSILGRQGGTQPYWADPADIVQQRLYEAGLQERMDEMARQEYAREFVENARKAGWDVILDENFKVIAVRRIRGTQQEPHADEP